MSQFQVVAVAGATGNTVGPHIVKELIKAKKTVKVLSRDTSKVVEGAQVVAVDYSNVESLTAALQGVDAVISTVGGAGLLDSQLNLIKAAQNAKVKRFYPSEFGTDVSALTGKDFVLVPWKQQVQKAVKESGLEYTLVNNGFFFTLLEPFFGFDWKAQQANIIGDGNTRISFTSLEDVAKYTVASLEAPESKNAAVNIDGDVKTWNEVVQIYEQVLGKKFTVQHTPLAEAKAKSDGSFNTVLLQLQILAADGKLLNIHSHNSLFSQVKATTIAEYAKTLSK